MSKIKMIVTCSIIVLIVGLVFFYTFFNKKMQLYKKNFFYMDTIIEVKIYSNNKSKALNALEKIDEIYNDYHKLSDRYNEYEDMINVYTINNNNWDQQFLTIDQRLYEMLEYGVSWYQKTNGLLDINMGCIIETWKNYFNDANGIPTNEQLNSCNSNPIVLKENNTILNNNPNIDLGAIAKGYATQVVSEYLESIGLDNYLINAGGNIIAGNHYNGSKYRIGIENPNDKSIYKIINVTNKAVITSGGYERFYEYDGHRYSHIINPKTKYPAEYMKSVTVVCDNSALGDILSTTLFLMSIDEGKEFVKNMNVDVIWYSNDDSIITTEGVALYE